jgi:hypothetical protein
LLLSLAKRSKNIIKSIRAVGYHTAAYKPYLDLSMTKVSIALDNAASFVLMDITSTYGYARPA